MTATVATLAPPHLFFTVATHDKPNLISTKILQALEKAAMDDESASLACRIFGSADELRVYLSEHGIGTKEAVAIFEHPRVKRCFSPVCRGTSAHPIPDWADQFSWRVAISPRCSEKRIPTITKQIFADFGDNFLGRMTAGMLPWGVAPTPRELKAKKGKNRGGREQGERFSRSRW